MANKAAIFRILADLADEQAGLAWAARVPGDAVSGNEAPVLACEDKNDKLRHIELREEGDAATGVLAIPALGFKDTSGQFAYGNLDVAGRILVSTAAAGTPKYDSDYVDPAALNTEYEVAVITLTVDKAYTMSQFGGSCLQEALFRLVWDNNGSPTEMGRFVVAEGDVAHEQDLTGISFTAGSTGTQKLQVLGTQFRGAKSELHGVVSCIEM